MGIRHEVCTGLLIMGMLAGCGNRDSGRSNENGVQQDPGAPPPAPQPAPASETFGQMRARLEADKPFYLRRQLTLLEERYDLSDRSSVHAPDGAQPAPGSRSVLSPIIPGWPRSRPEQTRP